MKLAAKSAAPIVRPASPEDAVLIRSLALRIWPISFAGILRPDQTENILEHIYSVEGLLEQMQEGHRFWIGYCGETPVGYVSAYREGDAIWLKKLYCDPAFQCRGIGTAMYEAAIAPFLPASEVRLLVHRDNLAAQGYYVHKGFKRIGEVPVKMGDFSFVDYLYSKDISSLIPT